MKKLLALGFFGIALLSFLVGQEFDARGRNVDKPYGEMYISTPVGTAVTAGTYVKIAGTTTFGMPGFLFDMPQDGRLRYVGVEDRAFLINIALSGTSTANNLLASLRVAVNDTTLPETQIDRFIAVGDDTGAVALTTIVRLSTNEYIELFTDIDSGSTTLTATHMIVTAVGVQ